MSNIYSTEQLINLINLAIARSKVESDAAKVKQLYGAARDAAATLLTGKNEAAGRVTQALATLGINVGDLATPAPDANQEQLKAVIDTLTRERDDALALAGKNEKEADKLHDELEAHKATQVRMNGITRALETNGVTVESGKELMEKLQPLLDKALVEMDAKKLIAAIPAMLDKLDLPTLVGNIVNAIKTGAEAVVEEVEAGDGEDEAKEVELMLSCATEEAYLAKILNRSGGGMYNCLQLSKYRAAWANVGGSHATH